MFVETNLMFETEIDERGNGIKLVTQFDLPRILASTFRDQQAKQTLFIQDLCTWRVRK
jgi:hypothetical protein